SETSGGLKATPDVNRRESLRPGPSWRRFVFARSGWTCDGQLLGSIDVVSLGTTAVKLVDERKPLEQRVSILWTKCHFGGAVRGSNVRTAVGAPGSCTVPVLSSRVVNAST